MCAVPQSAMEALMALARASDASMKAARDAGVADAVRCTRRHFRGRGLAIQHLALLGGTPQAALELFA